MPQLSIQSRRNHTGPFTGSIVEVARAIARRDCHFSQLDRPGTERVCGACRDHTGGKRCNILKVARSVANL